MATSDADEDRATRERREWDQRYSADGDEPMWSGAPNGSLVAEVADLEPGTALDVGCGEGADAVWLAQRGWRVTALDPSGVALARAAAAARDAGVEVTWVQAGLVDVPGGTGQHDLVTTQYPAILKGLGGDPVGALLGAVAPGGTLLFVHHEQLHAGGPGHEHGHAHGHEHGHGAHVDDAPPEGHDHGPGAEGFDPDDYVLPADVADALDDRWAIEVDEVRDRPGPLPADARHVRDVVLRARRLP